MKSLINTILCVLIEKYDGHLRISFFSYLSSLLLPYLKSSKIVRILVTVDVCNETLYLYVFGSIEEYEFFIDFSPNGGVRR